MGNDQQKVAVVTGGGRGIGHATSVRLASAGFAVAVNYLENAEAAQATVSEIEKAGGRALAVQADVRNADQVKAMFAQVKDALGPVEVLVNNAGVARDNFTPFMTEAQWDEVLDIDLKGAFLCTREASKSMTRTRSGRIINDSAEAGLTGDNKRANYAAAKAGLIGLTRATARDLATFGITVNAVAPGYIETDFMGDLNEQTRSRIVQNVPLKRLGRPGEVAELIAFLAGEHAGYITGAVFVIDGGLNM